jgi:hypothetical protein
MIVSLCSAIAVGGFTASLLTLPLIPKAAFVGIAAAADMAAMLFLLPKRKKM